MSRVTPVRYFRLLLVTRPIGGGKKYVFYSGRPSAICTKNCTKDFPRSQGRFLETLLIRTLMFADYPSSVSRHHRPGARSDGCHHPSLSIVPSLRFNGCRSNLASNFGPGFRPSSLYVKMGTGQTDSPRRLPYFITAIRHKMRLTD
jgi:hypothetical protein